MAPQGFKQCVICSQKIPLSDGHDKCLFCLGESHQDQSCIACKGFSKQAIKLRCQRLRSFLYEKTLSPNMENVSLTALSLPRAEASKQNCPADQPLLTISVLVNAKDASKPPKAKLPSRPAKKKATDKPKRAEKPTKLPIVPPPAPSILLEESSREAIGLSDAEEHIPLAQMAQDNMCMLPNSGRFEAEPDASRAVAHPSPRYSGRADTESPSEQESDHETPRKRTAKRKNIAPYQPRDGGDGYRPQGPPQFGHPFYAPFHPYPYQGYAYQPEPQAQVLWHHTVAPSIPCQPHTQQDFSTPQAPSRKRQFPTVPTALPKRAKYSGGHPLVRATTLYFGPDARNTVPFSQSTQSDVERHSTKAFSFDCLAVV
ncbi:uncharacterized protein LOC144586685 [Pogona vitticeps]